MGRPNHVKERFAQVLRTTLVAHFGGRLPSNAVIAREFNLRAYGADPVTQESVRRWVQGISMPDETKLRILVVWLDLDLRSCFSAQDLRGASAPASQNGNDSSPKTTRANSTETPENKLSKQQARILRLIEGLSNPDRRLVEQLTKKLSLREAHLTNPRRQG